ncbi:MAG: phage terminase large subunit family protein [Verrucomicrobiota bacterium]
MNAMLQHFLRAQKKKFKGTIWENARNFRLVGAAYASMPAEQDGFFDIKTARQLQGPLTALNDPLVRMVFIIGAVQVLKSVAGDITVVFWIEHTMLNILIIFEDDPKAEKYSKTRLMTTIKDHPVIRAMNASLEQKTDRHNVTNLMLRLPGGRTVMIGGANDGNLSSFSWPLLWGSEAWQWKPGMLKKFIRRADRYPDNHKILIETQASLADSDLHEEANTAHIVPLTWACPYCGGRQTWECDAEYGKLRPMDFTPIKPNVLPEGQLNLWAPPQPGTYAGMKFIGPEQTLPDGSTKYFTISERARTAQWECYHCGTLIADTKELRMKIADTYEQDYRLPAANGKPPVTPKRVCFILPKEAAWNNRFESGVLAYLDAKDAQASGNEIKLQDWYLQERAVFYSKRLTQTRVAVIVESAPLDAQGLIPNEKFRHLVVDCQKDVIESLRQGKDLTGHFWAIVEATDKGGNTFMLWRGYVTGWEQLFGKNGIKEKFKVPTRNVAIDGGNWFDLVKEKAAYYRTKEYQLTDQGQLDKTKAPVWATWRVMVGDDGKGVRWEDGTWRSYWPAKVYLVDTLDAAGQWHKIKVNVIRWSNFAVKSVLYKLRMGAPGQPKFVALPPEKCDAKTAAKEKGKDFSYEEQMNGFSLGEDAKGKPKFIEHHPQQHYPDCHCMGIVLKMMAGLVRGEAASGDGAGEEGGAEKK